MGKAYIKTEESGMHYVYILPKMLDSKYWYYDKQVHYTGHMHHNSPYATDSDCGNCNGVRCDYCKKIINEGIFIHGVECNILENWLTDAGVPKDIAADAVYNNFYSPSKSKYCIMWPDEFMLKKDYPEEYKKICIELGYTPNEFVETDSTDEKESKLSIVDRIVTSVNTIFQAANIPEKARKFKYKDNKTYIGLEGCNNYFYDINNRKMMSLTDKPLEWNEERRRTNVLTDIVPEAMKAVYINTKY